MFKRTIVSAAVVWILGLGVLSGCNMDNNPDRDNGGPGGMHNAAGAANNGPNNANNGSAGGGSNGSGAIMGGSSGGGASGVGAGGTR